MVLGNMGTNCFIVSDEATSEAVVIDPGDQAYVIKDYLDGNGLKLQAILLTHGHFDHIMAVGELVSAYGVKVYAGAKEKELLANADANLSRMTGKAYGIEADEWLVEGQEITFGNLQFRVIETPGHTIGGVCFYCEKEGILFAGDTLFCESIGRTDFPTGNYETLIRSIKEKLLKLPGTTRVYTGHGGDTLINYEAANNPFLDDEGGFWL
ncbi:MAG: MBL fold metallo-hydrolase [Lachnospiraceae bacterium]|nr:MBL fold metallo-hydrolase [Lachnospiraceae bacterium]